MTHWLKRTTILCVTGLVTTALISCQHPQGDDSGDSQSTVVVSKATIGPDGGALTLDNGTRFVFPAGSLDETYDFVIREVDVEETDMEEGYLRILTPFVIEPVVASVGERFWIELPGDALDGLDTEATAEDIVLVVSSDGISESLGEDATSSLERIHPMYGSEGVENNTSRHGVAFTGYATFQPMVPVFDGSEDRRSGSVLVGSGLGWPCSVAMGLAGMTTIPADIDSRVILTTTIAGDINNEIVNMGADPTILVPATARFLARSCMSVYRSEVYYRVAMELPMPGTTTASAFSPHPVPLTIKWSDPMALAEANGAGITVFFKSGNIPAYTPYDGSTPSWNHLPTGGETIDTVTDLMEGVVAHEMFHYVEDWANDVVADSVWGIDGNGTAFTEGGADAAGDMVFDNSDQTYSGLRIYDNNQSPWDESYPMHAFWRYLDWTQEAPAINQSVLKRILDKVAKRAEDNNKGTHITGADVDAAIKSMYPSESDMNRHIALADFAAEWLYRHQGFERAPLTGATNTPSDYDRTPDVMGVQLDEESWPNLWASYGVDDDDDGVDDFTFSNIPDDPSDPMREFIKATAMDDFPVSETEKLSSARTRLFEIDLIDAGITDETVAILVTATASGAPVDHVAARLFRDATASEESAPLGKLDTVNTATNYPSFFTIAGKVAGQHKLYLTTTNTGDVDVDIEVEVTAGGGNLVVSVDTLSNTPGLVTFDVLDTALTYRTWLTTSSSTEAVALSPVFGALAMASSVDGYNSLFSLVEGLETEHDMDLDSTTTTDGAPPGITRLFVGDVPRGIAFTHKSDVALVATADGVAVVDTNVMDANKPVELLGVLGNGALGLSGSHRPSAIAILPDDSRAYVAVRGSPWEPADEVLVVDLADLISGTFDASVVTKRIDTGWDTNPSAIAESPDGQFVAVACPNINTVAIISTATDEIYDVSPGTSRLHLSVPLSQNPSEYPTSITWAEDNDTVYVGFLSGYLGGALDTSGAVRKCEISAGRCWHEVGVSGPVRGVTVRGKGADRVVWVADDLGYITPLQDYLFIPSSTTSGVDTYGLLDGTGGCIEVRGSHPFDKNIAIPCEPAVRVGSGDFLSGIASY